MIEQAGRWKGFPSIDVDAIAVEAFIFFKVLPRNFSNLTGSGSKPGMLRAFQESAFG